MNQRFPHDRQLASVCHVVNATGQALRVERTARATVAVAGEARPSRKQDEWT
jgi:hypothetical protein